MPEQATERRKTIRVVAERAGCSVATVSRVINGSGPSSADTRARVEAAIADLGFRPNILGQSLRTQRVRAIGVIVPSFTNPVFAASLAGIEAVARGAGRQLLLSATDYDPAHEDDSVETLLHQRVEALILTVADAASSTALKRLDGAGVPYILLHNRPRQPGRRAVTVDNHGAAAGLTRRLIALGHRRVAYIGGPFRTTDRSALRFEGCKAAMAEAGLAAPALLELDYLAGIDDHAAVLERALPRLGNPTALLCSNDLLALSVIAALRLIGRAVPGDLSVTGFDGIAFGRMVSPSLATVATPTRAMGERAMRRLMTILSGAEDTAPAVELLPYEFRPGGTLAAVPGGRAGKSERRSPARPS
ncbi:MULTISPECIES: LacI family DNA-binding transcriptional regulator [Rhodomicrobium]|uniref:LacI family DNA-binding transcriptional regulator n=1 Tax=Rhodomicrobium TaxID=1068 RepID=UPI000B4AE1E5|nr:MULTISPECIES: LacI family DNA-binding transcriptional regulator [Rhodomicrobium]